MEGALSSTHKASYSALIVYPSNSCTNFTCLVDRSTYIEVNLLSKQAMGGMQHDHRILAQMLLQI